MGCGIVERVHMGIAQEIPNTRRPNNESSQDAYSLVVLPIKNDTNHNDGAVLLLKRMTRYLREEVLVDDGYAHVMDRCINQNASCVEWASSSSSSADECRTNHEYMTDHCRLACQRCHYDSKYISLFLK
eukprot:scaffold134338_cov46-Attheya_sp.AAC.2